MGNNGFQKAFEDKFYKIIFREFYLIPLRTVIFGENSLVNSNYNLDH